MLKHPFRPTLAPSVLHTHLLNCYCSVLYTRLPSSHASLFWLNMCCFQCQHITVLYTSMQPSMGVVGGETFDDDSCRNFPSDICCESRMPSRYMCSLLVCFDVVMPVSFSVCQSFQPISDFYWVSWPLVYVAGVSLFSFFFQAIVFLFLGSLGFLRINDLRTEFFFLFK
jgi:hypothetical protein